MPKVRVRPESATNHGVLLERLLCNRSFEEIQFCVRHCPICAVREGLKPTQWSFAMRIS